MQSLGKARVVPGNGTEMLRGVFSLAPEDDLTGSAVVYAETAHPGMTISFDTPKVYLASDLSNKNVVATLPANLTDPYEPCTVIADHGYTGVWEVELDSNSTSDTLNIEMCSPGGYDQVRLLASFFWLNSLNVELRIVADLALSWISLKRFLRNFLPTLSNLSSIAEE
jgi:hypothetical protein